MQIIQSAVGVAQTAHRVPGYGADREVAPRQIILHAADKAHRIRVAAVRIAAVRAEGCNLERAAVGQQGQRAVLEAGLEHALPCENGFHLFRARCGAQVPVVRRGAAQTVAHAAADRPSFKPGALQLFDRTRGVRGQPDQCPFLF